MDGPIVSVIIPSRLEYPVERPGALFVEDALRSIRGQNGLPAGLRLQVVIGVDAGAAIPDALRRSPGVTIAESRGRGQAAALNAAAEIARGTHLAFLEDDDAWHPAFLGTALRHLVDADFVSTTQLEVTGSGEILRIHDFPVPSGWVMRRQVWDRVGGFDESYRWHLDNEWLGRLAQHRQKRIHLVEATAPVAFEMAIEVRPHLAAVLKFGGPEVALLRHRFDRPLVVRRVHPRSGTQRTARSPQFSAESQREFERLKQRFGHIPC